jgi:hypothetical protein
MSQKPDFFIGKNTDIEDRVRRAEVRGQKSEVGGQMTRLRMGRCMKANVAKIDRGTWRWDKGLLV